jgi:hypothetical protein
MKPDEPLQWAFPQVKQQLNLLPFLTRLFDRDKQFKIIYNTFPYQKEKNNINTCGRHIIFRIKKLIDHDMDIQQYYNHMMKKASEFKMTPDQIVGAMTA